MNLDERIRGVIKDFRDNIDHMILIIYDHQDNNPLKPFKQVLRRMQVQTTIETREHILSTNKSEIIIKHQQSAIVGIRPDKIIMINPDNYEEDYVNQVIMPLWTEEHTVVERWEL